MAGGFDRNAIEKRLGRLRTDRCAAFTVQAALRVLPLLVDAGEPVGATGQRRAPFWYWKEGERGAHLLAVLLAQSSTLFFCVGGMRDGGEAAAAHRRRAYAAAYAAVRSTARRHLDTATLTAMIESDLALLESNSAADLLRQPLWSNGFPDDRRVYLAAFEADARSLGAGFEVWLDWYQDRLDGKPIAPDLLERWHNIPPETEAQGPAAVNAHLANLANHRQCRLSKF